MASRCVHKTLNLQHNKVDKSHFQEEIHCIYIYKAARCSLQDLKRFYSMLSLFVLHRIFRRLTDSAGFAGLQI